MYIPDLKEFARPDYDAEPRTVDFATWYEEVFKPAVVREIENEGAKQINGSF